MPIDLSKTDLTKPDAKGSDFAKILGISSQAVSEMIRSGTLRRGDSLQQWIQQLDQHKTAMLTGASGSLAENKADHAYEQARALRIKNDLAERELVHSGLLMHVFGKMVSKVVPVIQAMPKTFKAQIPYLETDDVMLISNHCNKVLTMMADAKIVDEDMPEQEKPIKRTRETA